MIVAAVVGLIAAIPLVLYYFRYDIDYEPWTNDSGSQLYDCAYIHSCHLF
jgi:biopolymer transport protein ExbB/TolQ